MNLLYEVENFVPYNEQEKTDQLEIINILKQNGVSVFSRQNKMMHITASAWIVNKQKSKALMAYHKIYNSWAWLGGHADGETNLHKVILKEISEESGLSKVSFVNDSIYSLEILTVDGHEKNGQYVSSHLHINITYLFEADENLPIRIKKDENEKIAWVKLCDITSYSSEGWFNEHIYKKLNDKLNYNIITTN